MPMHLDPELQQYPVESSDEKAQLKKLFLVAAGVRFLLSVAIFISAAALNQVSRDSVEYHWKGIKIAEQYAAGEVQWALWVDEGWEQFFGLVYYVFGPYLLIINLINAICAGGAAILLYRITRLLTGLRSVAAASAYAFALFPSAVYFHALPLKECAAILGILWVIWGILQIVILRRRKAWLAIFGGLAIIAALRVYLVGVFAICILFSLLPLRLPRTVSGLITPAIFLLLTLGGFYYTVDALQIDLSQYEALQYFDIEQLNDTRASLSRGSGAMFDRGEDTQFGRDPLSDIWLAAKGVYFFVAGVDLFDIRSTRQALAIPEMLLMLYCLPSLIAGVVVLWQRNPRAAMPVLLFTVVVIAIYGAATTNMGAMYRWRLQALPCLIILILYGAYSRRRGPLAAFVRRFERPVHGQSPPWARRQSVTG